MLTPQHLYDAGLRPQFWHQIWVRDWPELKCKLVCGEFNCPCGKRGEQLLLSHSYEQLERIPSETLAEQDAYLFNAEADKHVLAWETNR